MTEKFIIGYYKLPSNPSVTVYVESVRDHRKITEVNVEPGKLDDTLDILKLKYPNHNVCEFKY